MKTALVTGADRGFGYCIATAFLQRGYTVYAGKFLDEYGLLEALAEEYPGRLIPVRLDVESRESIINARTEAERHAKHLDVLVSNAAFMGMGPMSQPGEHAAPPDLKEHIIDVPLTEKSICVNALGALQCAEIFLPMLEKSEMKRLCFVSSEVSSVNQMRRDSAFRYPASKTALNMAVRMLHNTLYPKGYTFRLYHPGWMRRMLPDGSNHPGDARQIDASYSAQQAIAFIEKDRPDEHRLVMVDYMGSIWPC